MSYTVNYLEKDTDKVLAPQLKVDNQTFGSVITSADKVIKIDGYTYDSVDKETLAIGTGENVINVYYTAIDYTVTYSYEGSVPVDATALPEETTQNHVNDSVTVADPATAEGFVFSGWTVKTPEGITVTDGEFTMPASNVVLVGHFSVAEGTKYTVQYWYQDPALNPETENGYIKFAEKERTTTSGEIAFITEEDTVTTRSMYQFNAEKTDVQKMVKADGSTVLNVYFDALYNVVYNVVDENGTVKREVARSGYVYRYNDLVKAPGVVNDELNKFDGKWYKDTAVTDEWSFKDTIEAAISAGLIISENNTMILYTKADVTPLTANTLRIEKQTVNAPNANTDYKFNLKLLAKVDTVTAPVEGEAAQKMHELSSAKITAEGKRDAAWNEVLGATDKFKNSAMVTTNSSLSFIMYGDKVEDINGDEINPALFSLGTTGSAYQFRSYNLFEDSFAVEPAEYASVDDSTLDWMVEIISNLANPYLRTPFQTLDPESVLTEMQVAGVNTSGSALAFGFDQASDLYLAAQDYFEKEKVFKAAEFELETYLVELNRRAVITVNGTQYILDAVDENGNALFEKDADGNYILNFDFTLKSGTFQDFKVEATTGSSIQFIVTETDDGGAISTTVNGEVTNSASGVMTTGSSLQYTFVNTFEDDGPVGPVDPGDGGDTTPTDPTDPDIEIEDPDVPLAEPEEPGEEIDIEDPEVPLAEVPGEEVEIDEPEVPLGDAPQTGDNSNTIPFVVLMLAAACGLVVTRRKLN